MNGPSYPLANPDLPGAGGRAESCTRWSPTGSQGTLMPAFATSAGWQPDRCAGGCAGAGACAPPGIRPAQRACEHDVRMPPYRAVKPVDPVPWPAGVHHYCASCHGNTGSQGRGCQEQGGSITEPAFLSLVSDQVLRTVVIAGRPDIGQPDWRSDVPGHPMSDQEVTDVVGWLSSQRPGAQQTKAGGGSQ